MVFHLKGRARNRVYSNMQNYIGDLEQSCALSHSRMLYCAVLHATFLFESVIRHDIDFKTRDGSAMFSTALEMHIEF